MEQKESNNFCLLFTHELTKREKMRSFGISSSLSHSLFHAEERVPPRAEEERKKASRTARVSISIASLKI